MVTVTFFGHRDTPQAIQGILESTIENLILNHEKIQFFVGNQGGFDRLVQKTLHSLEARYPHILCFEILAYFPVADKEKNDMQTIYPEGLEKTPPKFSIARRNRWMVDHSDVVITYVTQITGGAFQFKKIAEKKGKTVINLPDKK